MISLLLCMVAMATSTSYADSSSGTYVLVAPSKLRPNSDFSMSVNVLTATADVDVKASIMASGSKTALATGTGTFKAGTPGTLTIKVPSSLSSSSYTLNVEGSGGLTFINSTQLGYTDKEFSLFIQTDKGIYKAGDIVNFRVFGMYADLKPYLGAVDIAILDKDSNKIKQWLQVTPTGGVITQKLVLSSQPTLGDWKITVSASKTRTEKVFSVAEYVLPKFEVSVDLPSYVLISQDAFTASIKATYTYGKPVKGTADVAVSFSRYGRDTQVSTSRTAVTEGESKVTVFMKDLTAASRYLDGVTVLVTANVTEDLTGNVMSANATVKLYSRNIKLSFPDSNPDNFKPGLQYTAILKVSQPDGLPATPGTEKVVVATTVTNDTGDFSYQRYSLKDVSLDVPISGMLAVPVSIPHNAKEISLTAKLSGVSAYLNLKKSHSPSKSYIELALKTPSKIEAGDSIDLEVTSTQPLTQLVYQILSRGRIVKTGTVTSPKQNVQPFSLTTDPSMAPSARIVVYYVRTDGEIVTDSISFDVDGAFINKVSVQLNTTDTGPGKAVEVTVAADPSSVAHLAAIDQSLLLLRSGNDVTAGDVMGELDEYDTLSSHSGGGGGGIRPMRDIWWGWPLYFGGSDAKQIFENSGVSVLTDCLVYHYEEPFPVIFPREEMFAFGEAAAGGAIPGAAPPPRAPQPEAASSSSSSTGPIFEDNIFPLAAGAAPGGGGGGPRFPQPDTAASGADSLKEPASVRSDFSETWLFLDSNVGANGTATTTATIPDTITSWVVSAFATNQMSGLGIAPSPAKLTVFKPFFVSLNLPYSVTRGEHLGLQANVFNYLQQDLTVKVTLSKSSDYYNIFLDNNKRETWRQETVHQDVFVKAGEAKSVYFPIIPAVLGRINLEVMAQSTVAADAVRRQLLVEAEGVPKEYNVPVLIDLTENRTTFSQTVDLTLPPITVQGSELVRISAVGDLMGPTVAGLDTLLRMPTGCGEQTMIGLAPDVYITDYLKASNQLSPDIESKALGFMESGYQRELTYKHKDGSFSAFGERDDSGSMWLTAFVTRVFHQAKAHIFVDDDVIRRAMKWMLQQQASNGSFPEPGRVIHKDMQGQAAGGLGLTCFVYISLLENRDLFTADKNFEDSMNRAQAYIEKGVASSSDVYILSMASYAFQLAKSGQAQNVLDRLEAMAVKDGNMRYWHKAEGAKSTTAKWKAPHGTKAVDTEMTSYVLLAYAAKQDIVGGKGILQWVAQQRNPNGGFTSTQDTVVALNAMSEFAKMTVGNDFNIQITARPDADTPYTFSIDKTNSLILQTRERTKVPSQVHVSATGTGLALVQVAVFFNVESEVDDVTFELTVNLLEETMNWLVVETCTRWIGEEETSAMAVQEIGIPSGFLVDTETLTELASLKRLEQQNKKLILYFDQIGKNDVCLTFRAQRTGLVAKSQPAAVRVYDYYEPGNQVTEFYESKILKESSVCQVCPDCANCV